MEGVINRGLTGESRRLPPPSPPGDCEGLGLYKEIECDGTWMR